MLPALRLATLAVMVRGGPGSQREPYLQRERRAAVGEVAGEDFEDDVAGFVLARDLPTGAH
jgi:hypothetical protein